MDGPFVVALAHEFLWTALLLIGPAVATSLIIGVVISIFQTITSIQEQTLTFAPRILGVGLVFGLTASWSLAIAVNYTRQLFELIVYFGTGT